LGDPSVTPSVEDMTYQRLAYDDAATTDQMATDCAAVGQALHPNGQLPGQRHLPEPHSVTDGVYDTVVVSDDLAALAAGLELHFD
jgi:hypothetical protein